ncbi:MAG: plasmid maintenance protein CcdB [Firmicutes bacterium HGW-Firmicutes-17]|jgi:toxin CcdB|nr:MAG: plasmid maintenance protein CcdB [Firmicutes bacterium HGW-Firmicutes-17]
MPQFDIYTNINQASKALYPYLVDVQSSLLENLETRLVIPLITKSKFGNNSIKNLIPNILIKNQEYFVITPQIAAINNKQLGKVIDNCKTFRNEIVSSIDFLITGF